MPKIVFANGIMWQYFPENLIYRTFIFIFGKKLPTMKGIRKILALAAFVASGTALASAQDIVTMKNGDTVAAKVLEIDEVSVKYRLFDEPGGVIYSVLRSGIRSIRYENGRVENFVGGDLFSDSGNTVIISGRRSEHAVPGMKYRDYSSLYRAADYTWAPGDRYLPALSGVASFIIPGLGQMICGEVGRGFAFLGMTVGVPVVATVAAVAFDSYASMASCIAVGVLGCLAIDIWNIVDAVQVAKIKNMYLQDMRREYSFDMDLFPSVNCIPTSSGMQTSFGLTLAMSF